MVCIFRLIQRLWSISYKNFFKQFILNRLSNSNTAIKINLNKQTTTKKKNGNKLMLKITLINHRYTI